MRSQDAESLPKSDEEHLCIVYHDAAPGSTYVHQHDGQGLCLPTGEWGIHVLHGQIQLAKSHYVCPGFLIRY